jgi:hypothetical protein
MKAIQAAIAVMAVWSSIASPLCFGEDKAPHFGPYVITFIEVSRNAKVYDGKRIMIEGILCKQDNKEWSLCSGPAVGNSDIVPLVLMIPNDDPVAKGFGRLLCPRVRMSGDFVHKETESKNQLFMGTLKDVRLEMVCVDTAAEGIISGLENAYIPVLADPDDFLSLNIKLHLDYIAEHLAEAYPAARNDFRVFMDLNKDEKIKWWKQVEAEAKNSPLYPGKK